MEIAYGGICGSDLHYWTHGAAGESILRAPMVLGHEVVGTVVRAAADGTGPAAEPGSRCTRPPRRRRRDPLPAPTGRTCRPAVTYLGSAARFPHTDGRLRPVRDAALPDAAGAARRRSTCGPRRAIEPASVAWHGVARAGDVAGQTVLVIGAGPIGALIVAVLAPSRRRGDRRRRPP